MLGRITRFSAPVSMLQDILERNRQLLQLYSAKKHKKQVKVKSEQKNKKSKQVKKGGKQTRTQRNNKEIMDILVEKRKLPKIKTKDNSKSILGAQEKLLLDDNYIQFNNPALDLEDSESNSDAQWKPPEDAEQFGVGMPPDSKRCTEDVAKSVVVDVINTIGDIKVHQCDVCEKKFKREKFLKAHIKNFHLEVLDEMVENGSSINMSSGGSNDDNEHGHGGGNNDFL